jgi:hypothetical protein
MEKGKNNMFSRMPYRVVSVGKGTNNRVTFKNLNRCTVVTAEFGCSTIQSS